MADYGSDNVAREANYSGLMSDQIMAFCEAVAAGNMHLEDLAEATIDRAFQHPNFDIDTAMAILGVDEGLRYSANLPRVLSRKLSPFLMHEATVSGSMDVSTSTEEAKHVESSGGFEGSAKYGFGPISATVKVHGSVGMSEDKKRKTDYRATVKWEVKMIREEPPEALMRIVDTLCKFLDTCNSINMEFAQAQAAVIRGKLPINNPSAAYNNTGDDWSDSDDDNYDDSGDDYDDSGDDYSDDDSGDDYDDSGDDYSDDDSGDDYDDSDDNYDDEDYSDDDYDE